MPQVQFSPQGNGFRPSYHDQKEDYQSANDDADTARAMKTILFPMEVAQQQYQMSAGQAALEARRSELEVRKQELDQHTKEFQDKRDFDAGYSEALPQITGNPDFNGMIDSPIAAKVKGGMQAFFDHQKLAHDDRATMAKKAMDLKGVELETNARINSGLLDDADWADPAQRKKAFLNEQIGPMVKTLGSDFYAVPMGDGRTAKDVLDDPTSYSKRGMLLAPVADQLMGNAAAFHKDREMKRKQESDLVEKKATLGLSADSQVDLSGRLIDQAGHKAMATKLADLESNARINSGLIDDEDWNDEAKRKPALLNEQIGPVRRALGADFNEVAMSDGRTAKDVLADPASYTKRGLLQPPIADELVGNAQQVLKDREAQRKQEGEIGSAAIQADRQKDVAKFGYELTGKERLEQRIAAMRLDARERAHRLALDQITKDPIMSIQANKPGGNKIIDDRAEEIYQRMAKDIPGGTSTPAPAAPAKAPAAVTVQRTAKDGSVWEYDANTKQPLRQVSPPTK